MRRESTAAGRIGSSDREQAPSATATACERWSLLMARAQDGDRNAYHELLAGITPYLRGLCGRHLGRCDEIEDAVQDILLVVHRIRHTYERDRPFKPWLSTIASRRIIDLLRRRTRRLSREVATADGTDGIAVAPSEAQPDRCLDRDQATDGVRRAVAALPRRQRDAIDLLRLHELSLDEAADLTRQSPGALKVACHRAMKSLRSAFHQGPVP